MKTLLAACVLPVGILFALTGCGRPTSQALNNQHSLAGGHADYDLLLPDVAAVSPPIDWCLKSNMLGGKRVSIEYADSVGKATIELFEDGVRPENAPDGQASWGEIDADYWTTVIAGPNNEVDSASIMFFADLHRGSKSVWYSFTSTRPSDSDMSLVEDHLRTVVFVDARR